MPESWDEMSLVDKARAVMSVLGLVEMAPEEFDVAELKELAAAMCDSVAETLRDPQVY